MKSRDTIPPALATVDDFLTLDLRVGTIVAARPLRGARRPALALTLDFGALGTLASSAGCRAAIFPPTCSIAAADGPINPTRASAQRRANSGFSDRNP